MRITLLGKRWDWQETARVRKHRGDVDAPHEKRKLIRIDPGLKDEERLEVELHELLHAVDWHKDETWVHDVARDIAKILYRQLGYRRQNG